MAVGRTDDAGVQKIGDVTAVRCNPRIGMGASAHLALAERQAPGVAATAPRIEVGPEWLAVRYRLGLHASCRRVAAPMRSLRAPAEQARERRARAAADAIRTGERFRLRRKRRVRSRTPLHRAPLGGGGHPRQAVDPKWPDGG